MPRPAGGSRSWATSSEELERFQSPIGMKRTRIPLQLFLLAALAVAVRGLGIAQVFPGGGWVELETGDSAYHARRALWSFVNFPSVLVFDSYMSYPGGAVVPMPPLYDWALGGLARLFGDGVDAFERVAAWFGPVLAGLSVLPVYAVGRAVGTSGVGLCAAALFALLPASARMSSVGDVDHHAAVALLGATYLAVSMSALRAEREPAGWWRLVLGGALVRAAILLTWSGSLLYVGLAEAALLLAAVVDGRRGPLFVQAAGCCGAALLVTPWLLSLDGAAAPGFSSTNLSWLHLVALLTAAATAAGLGGLADPRSGAGRRLVLALGLSATLIGAALFLLPSLREGLGPGLSFLAKQDSWGRRNLEQQALSFAFAPGASGIPVARDYYGWLAYALPLAFAAVLLRLRDPATRGPAVLLACWAGALGLLALLQVRFISDFAPVAAVAFAVLLAAGHAMLTRGMPARLATAVLFGASALLLWPGLDSSYGPKLARLRVRVQEGEERGPTRLASGVSLARFARTVREATPETSGYLDSVARPEYAVLSAPSHGHTLHYMARRPTPANNFGPYLHRDRYLAAELFYSVPSEDQALAIARGTGSRYVVTFAREEPRPERFADLLHHWDGARGQAASHFRLVAEGPARGTPRRTAFPGGRAPRGTVPYKLFEVVEGAVLEARAEPDAEIRAELWLVTPLGRRFRYRSVTRANANGIARLRVPYATDSATAVVAEGPYRIFSAGQVKRVEVPNRAVLRGEVVGEAGPGTVAPPQSR